MASAVESHALGKSFNTDVGKCFGFQQAGLIVATNSVTFFRKKIIDGIKVLHFFFQRVFIFLVLKDLALCV